MRVWDIHPGYLSNRSLLGEHVEIHALCSIITGGKNGYSRHPETKRWVENINQLVSRHNLVVKEMLLRDFKHNSPLQFSENIKENYRPDNLSYVDLPVEQFAILYRKYSNNGQSGRIPLPKNGTEFWAHHKYSIMVRGYQYYKEVQKYIRDRHVYPIQQENVLIDKIINYMKMEISEAELENVILHLWRYFKNKASQEEKRHFFDLPNFTSRMDMLFSMVKKYQENYLLYSTIFADFLPC